MGYQAGYSTTTGVSNTMLGYQSGYSNTTGLQNTFIGRDSGYAVTTGTKNTIVGMYNGNQGGLDIRTASNRIVLSDGDGNPRGIFDSSGNLLVGTTTASGAGGVTIYPNGSGSSGQIAIAKVADGVTNNAMAFFASGSVIGTISISDTNTAFNTASDYRLKNTIEPMTGALAKVALLKPCTYKWNIDGSSGEGFIAHELAEICPQAVTGEKDGVETYTDEDGNEQTKPQYQGIDVSFLVATLTSAIQEQQAIIESLKARLDAANL